MATARVYSPDIVRVTGELERAVAALKNPTPLLKAFGVVGLGQVQRNFRDGGRPTWKPLKPRTIAARRAGKGSGSAQPLRNTGALQRSWDARLHDRSVEIFSDSPVAIYHEQGTKGPYVIKPKRRKVLAFPTGPTTFAGTTIASVRGERRIVSRKAGTPVLAAKGVAFATQVIHPGLPVRRMTPTEEQLRPGLEAAARHFLKRVLPGA